MLTKFQIEPPHAARHQNRLADWLGHSQLEAAIESLLLGQWFRNELTASEVNLLKVLSDSDTPILLFCGERCLNTASDSPQVIDAELTAIIAGSEAIFHQRANTPDRTRNENSAFAAARIGIIDNEPIILACPHSDNTPGDLRGSGKFEELLATFRKAHKTATALAQRLAGKYSSDMPGMIVHSTSGRIMACNEALGRLINTATDDIIDREYSTVAALLTASPVRHRIRLENLSLNGCRLTVVSAEPITSNRADTEHPKFYSEFFFHSFRNNLSAIMTAASHLQMLAEGKGSAEEQELATIVLGEASALDRHLNRMALLTGRLAEPTEPIPVAASISDAIDCAHLDERHQIELSSADLPQDSSVAVSASVIAMLIETILRSHLRSSAPASRSRIEARSTDNQVILAIETCSEKSAATPLTFDRNWQTMAVSLSTRLGLQCAASEMPDQGGLRTQINFPAASPRSCND